MGRLNNEKKRALAERMFIEDGMTAKAIAQELEVTPQTVGRWRTGRKNEKDWDYRRAEVLSAPHKIKEILLQELRKVAEGEESNIDADALAKISKVMDTLTAKVSVQAVISVLKEFDLWMANQDPEMAVSFLDYHKQFILHKASE